MKKQQQKLVINNARIMDPETGLDVQGQLIAENGVIVDFGTNILESMPEDAIVIDAKNQVLAPGLIDIQVHFREPGQTHKEDLASGSMSAAKGGITTVVCQPNTKPVLDDVMTLDWLNKRAAETACINIKAYAAITKGMQGQELSDMGKLIEMGAVGFTDDGLPVMNPQLMRRAFEYSKMFDTVLAQHAEDLTLSQGGCINEGAVSFKLGVTGIPNISESVMVQRDISILELTGGRYHVLHVSTKESVEAIRIGKAKGLNVTAEASPHHIALTDEAVLKFGTNAKMNPPLRSEADRLAVIEALKDGTIDAIATDHAPHEIASKELPLAKATFGIVGVETMLPIALELYHSGQMSLMDVLAKMTCNAAKIIKSDAGRIKKGAPADLVIIDPNHEYVIDSSQFLSKSKNSPFDGRKVKGIAVKTICNGNVVYG